MTPNELRQKYLNFFEKNGHAIVPSSPLVPDNDPTTLFTGSGMQPMVPYLLGEKHQLGTRIVDSQKCFRSQDIEEVGDNRHTTFFEMLGNWSLGDYFKNEQLEWFFTFLTDTEEGIGLDPQRLFISVFRGAPEINVPKDTEAVEIWKKLYKEKGIEAKDVDFPEKDGMQDGRIFYYEAKKNWWSRAGGPEKMPVGEPGGPDSEVFYDFGADLKLHENSVFKDEPCHVNCDCGRFMEIGNSVFMEYVKTETGFEKLPAPNVDFGGGLERILCVVNKEQDVFKTPSFETIIKVVEEMSGKKYEESEEVRRSFRVIADHLRGAVMLAADGVFPSNKAQGYFSRRLVRRAIRYAKMIGINKPFVAEISKVVADLYAEPYPEVSKQLNIIIEALSEEEGKFLKTINNGLKKIEKILGEHRISGSATWLEDVDQLAKIAFDLYQTDGLPVDIVWEEFEKEFGAAFYTSENKLVFLDKFNELREEHSKASRTASVGMFKGGLQDHSAQTTKYHTATHLLHAALRKVLGTHVQQKGSNITGERLRFDFSHPVAMTEDEKRQVQDQINEWIKQDLPVTKQIMQKEDALKSGAIAFFIEKYPDEVSVYTVGKDVESDWISKEFCGGPHVEHTGEIGEITIQKEQAVSAGVRRIYLV